MKLHKVFVLGSALLGGLLLIQLVVMISQDQKPHRGIQASWVDKAENMVEAIELSDEVVMGEVIRVRRGKDIVVKKIEGDEPGAKGGTFTDRIPTMRVDISVMETLMKRSDEDRGKERRRGKDGDKERVITLFQTGDSVDENPDVALPDETRPPVELAADPDEGEHRMFILQDDPPYLVGEQYALFLTEGPKGSKATMAVIAPEGRYRIDMRDGEMMMHPVTDRGMALTKFDMPRAKFVAEVCDTMTELGMEEMMGDGCL